MLHILVPVRISRMTEERSDNVEASCLPELVTCTVLISNYKQVCTLQTYDCSNGTEVGKNEKKQFTNRKYQHRCPRPNNT